MESETELAAELFAACPKMGVLDVEVAGACWAPKEKGGCETGWFPNPPNPVVPMLEVGWGEAEAPALKELDANGLFVEDPRPAEKLKPVGPPPPKENDVAPLWLDWVGAELAPGKLWL